MGRRVVGEGYVVPLGLLPSPTMPRLFAMNLGTESKSMMLKQSKRFDVSRGARSHCTFR